MAEATKTYGSSRSGWGAHAATAPVTVGLILDIVGAVGDQRAGVATQIQQVYDWRHARNLALLQLSLAPAAIAALVIIVSKDASFGVALLVAALLATSLCGGIWRYVELTRFDREYVLALQLATVFAPFHRELSPDVHAERGNAPDVPTLAWPPCESNQIAVSLHTALRGIPMFRYRSNREAQEAVRVAVTRAHALASTANKYVAPSQTRGPVT